MNEASFEGEKMEQAIDYEEKIEELRDIVNRAMRAQIPKKEEGHVYNPDLWQELNKFATKLQNSYGSDYYKYRAAHILGSSTLSPEEEKKSFTELKVDGTFIDFDFPGEDSVENFLKNLDFKNQK